LTQLFLIFHFAFFHSRFARGTKELNRGFKARLLALIATQFQVAFRDNVLKNPIIFMILDMNVSIAEKEKISSFGSTLFALPFILFRRTAAILPIVSANSLRRLP
jgi:hypothetical protein